MSDLLFATVGPRERFGFKGPRAAEWLSARGIGLPAAPNTWTSVDGAGDAELLVARLGAAEYFLEEGPAGTTVSGLKRKLAETAGVYPVLREDAAFVLSGAAASGVLNEVCNVDFAALPVAAQPAIMTSMIGVAVLVVPQGGAAPWRFRIWCDPTFAPYFEESVGRVVTECGGQHRGA